MDIKDVNPPAVENLSQAREALSAESNEKNSRSLKRNDAAVTIDARVQPTSLIKTRKAANEIINTINLIVDSTGEIDRLVKSIDGIVQQASKGDVPEKRLAVLEREANQILDAIKRRVDLTQTSHGNPLIGDLITLDSDSGLGSELTVKLPNHAKENFGLKKIDFSKKDSISETRSNVDAAQSQVNELKSKVAESRDSVHHTVAALDVALQNLEAAGASVRELDEALKLAGSTKLNINLNPDGALGSLGKLGRNALDLLD